MTPWLYRFAVLTAAVTVGLIVAGATVTSTGSGDAVPDWPLAYGSFFPRMVGGVLIEHSHRLIAGLTASLIAVLAFWLWRREPRRWVRHLGVWVLVAVLAQAALGGLRVLIISQEDLQAAALRVTGVGHVNPVRIGIAATHAFLAQVVLCLTFVLAATTAPAGLDARPGGGASRPGPARGLMAALVLAVFVQLMLGALMRHMGAGLVVPDFPRVFGGWWPAMDRLPYNPQAPFAVPFETYRLQVLVHFSHRVMALVVTGLVAGVAGYFWRTRRAAGPWTSPIPGRLVGGLVALTAAQVGLGALAIWTQKAVPVTIAHVAVGALLLGSSVLLLLWTWRVRPLAGERAADLSLSVGLKPARNV